MENRTDKIIDFLKEIEKLKYVEREIYLKHRKENSVEHSWHLAMFVILFEKDLPKELNFEKMLKMALIHDLVEIYAGDTFAFDPDGIKGKKEREQKAAEKLFSQLPEDLNKELMDLFYEYEKRESQESKFVKSFDQIQPILQNLTSEGKSWKEHNIKYETVDNVKRKNMTHNELILEIYEKLMKEAKDKELL